jgi:CubicO group peptidase (beta-lactamase class C family)
MTHTALELNHVIRPHLASGYQGSRGKIRRRDAPARTGGSRLQGTEWRHLHDGGRCRQVCFVPYGLWPQTVLKTKRLEYYEYQVEVTSTSQLTDGYGLGFIVLSREHYIAFGHGGAVAGYQAELFLNRDRDLALIVLANALGPGSVNTGDLGLRSLDLVSKWAHGKSAVIAARADECA